QPTRSASRTWAALLEQVAKVCSGAKPEAADRQRELPLSAETRPPPEMSLPHSTAKHLKPRTPIRCSAPRSVPGFEEDRTRSGRVPWPPLHRASPRRAASPRNQDEADRFIDTGYQRDEAKRSRLRFTEETAQKGRGIFMVYVDIDAQHVQEFN